MNIKSLAAFAIVWAFACCPAGADATLKLLGRFETGEVNVSALEIGAYHPGTQRYFAVHGTKPEMSVFDLSHPAQPKRLESFDLSQWGGNANSVAVHGDLVAVAVEAIPKTAPGSIVFFNPQGAFYVSIPCGAQPDMVTFSPDGRYVLSADEGEPSDDYKTDPLGSITVVDLSGGIATLTPQHAKTLNFLSFEDKLNPGVRVYGPGASPAQDLEPEYIAVTPDSRRAYVTLQENNAIAILSLGPPALERVISLGLKDHRLARNALDPSDKDGITALRTVPVFGMYQPDAIKTFIANGALWLMTANEGDRREWSAYVEPVRVKKLPLDSEVFPDAVKLQEDAQLGRLQVSKATGDTDGDGDYDELHAFGARSIAVWDAQGRLVYDTGKELEAMLLERLPDHFNADDADNDSKDQRSDNRGPEPEGLAIGTIGGTQYAFCGLERPGGIVVYDLTHPYHPRLVDYINTRDFTGDVQAGTAGDVGPEGLVFVAGQDSPTGRPLLIASYEMSGTLAVFEAAPKNE